MWVPSSLFAWCLLARGGWVLDDEGGEFLSWVNHTMVAARLAGLSNLTLRGIDILYTGRRVKGQHHIQCMISVWYCKPAKEGHVPDQSRGYHTQGRAQTSG